MQLTRCGLLAVATLATAGCGDDSPAVPDSPDAAVPAIDAAPEVYDQHECFVMARVVLPVTGDDAFANGFAFPGVGQANRLGNATAALLDFIEGIPLQAEVDASFTSSQALQILRLSSNAAGTSANAALTQVVDADEPVDPSNDFSGTGQFRLAPGAQLDVVAVAAPVASGLMSGAAPASSATLLLPLVVGETPTLIPVSYPQVRLERVGGGLGGSVGGAVSVVDLHTHLYPAIATLFTRAIAESTPQAGTISSIFDADDDDTITVEELVANSTLAIIMAPDVDLDGDGDPEHLSAGNEISAVACELVE